VEKREIKIPMEIQKQAVDLDEKMFEVPAPAVGPWQRQLNELGGVKPLAFGQYGELGPGLSSSWTAGPAGGGGCGRSGQAVPHPQPSSSERSAAPAAAAAGVVMTAQKAQADVLLHRLLHYALPGWDAATERRDAQDELHSAAQARAWADGDFDADHGFASDGVGRSSHRGGGGGCARALALYKPPSTKKRKEKVWHKHHRSALFGGVGGVFFFARAASLRNARYRS
jgi:hypothetical protein